MIMDSISDEEEQKLLSVATAEYEMTKLKYESELRREDSLIQQSGHMQAVFAFTTAALFMAFPMLIEHRGYISLEFFLAAGSSITTVVLFSLFAATVAQNRKKQTLFPNSEDSIKYIEDNEPLFQTEIQRKKYYAVEYSEAQKSLTTNNEKRVKWIQCSMWSFYVALGLCVIWFIVGLIKLF